MKSAEKAFSSAFLFFQDTNILSNIDIHEWKAKNQLNISIFTKRGPWRAFLRFMRRVEGDYRSSYPSVAEGIALVNGREKPATLMDLKRLVLTCAGGHLGETVAPEPPGFIFHISQVATLAGIALIDQPEETQVAGQILAWSHDIGRAVELGRLHTLVGARMLESLGYDKKVVSFALAHHRWGLGLPNPYNGNFPLRVKEALEKDDVGVIFEEMIANFGIEALVVLLADNSKELKTAGSFEPTIVPFNEELGHRLIQVQINHGRYQDGSYTHQVELIGMRFLLRLVPFLEDYLGINYNPNVITKARDWWMDERQSLIALWQEVAYHEANGA
ncbi:MAG: hypothetical protein ACOY0S_00305 [Patescibacteria group bacterium]